MSSSPSFPSPNTLLWKRCQLRTGGRATPIPKDATSSFTTAACPLQKVIADDRRQINTSRDFEASGAAAEEDISDKTTKAKSIKKPPVGKDASDQNDPAVKKPRKPRVKKCEPGVGDAGAAKEKCARKPRIKKDDSGGQTKISKGKVTKALAGSRVEKAAKKATGTVSGHFVSTMTEPAEPLDADQDAGIDSMLQQAVKRRVNWTPPRDTACSVDPAEAPVVHDEAVSTVSSDLPRKQNSLKNLFRDFGYSNGEETAVSSRDPGTTGAKKRKLIDLVKPNVLTPAPPITKVKSVKKKPRTITELATSAYAIDAERTDPARAPLLQYFSSDSPSSNGGDMLVTNESNSLPKPRSRSPMKTGKKSSKSKKGTALAPILLSPQTALKQVDKQEFVFGTSSQLAREESPTLLRDLQKALQESNQIEDDPFADNIESVTSSKSASMIGKGTASYAATRNLWAAASRGNEGAIMDIETVDLSTSPKGAESTKSCSSVPALSEAVIGPVPIPDADVWHRLDEDALPVVEPGTRTKPPPPNLGPMEAAIRADLHSSSATVGKTGKASLSKVNPSTSTIFGCSAKESSGTQKPDYGSYATAQLAKEIASYHFKPVKGRDKMIALLEKCWEGNQRVVFGSLGTNAVLSVPPVKSSQSREKAIPTDLVEAPKSSVGRPRKDGITLDSPARANGRAKSTKGSTEAQHFGPDINQPLALRQTPRKQRKRLVQTLEEIYDSDVPCTPSPPRRRGSQIKTPLLPLQPSTSNDLDNSLVLSPTSQQLRLHEHITRAITTAPPSKDPHSPSWHEKILLYDPIVLEDLATWLNTGALEKVGWDGEVDPKEVKRWCLEKSICCLWRENLRGRARSRY